MGFLRRLFGHGREAPGRGADRGGTKPKTEGERAALRVGVPLYLGVKGQRLGPFSPETHWAQTYMSFSPRPVRAGERLAVSVDFAYDPDPAEVRRYVELRVGVGEDELNYLIE